MLQLKQGTLYINLDFETTGITPSRHSVISIGAVFHNARKEELGRFHEAIAVDRECWDPNTLKWWKEQMRAGTFPPLGLQSEKNATQLFFATIERKLKENNLDKVVFVAYPAGFEYSFLRELYQSHYYAHDKEDKFNRIDFIDLRTLYAGSRCIPFEDAGHASVPEHWWGGRKITHNALEDALAQVELWKNLTVAAEVCG